MARRSDDMTDADVQVALASALNQGPVAELVVVEPDADLSLDDVYLPEVAPEGAKADAAKEASIPYVPPIFAPGQLRTSSQIVKALRAVLVDVDSFEKDAFVTWWTEYCIGTVFCNN